MTYARVSLTTNYPHVEIQSEPSFDPMATEPPRLTREEEIHGSHLRARIREAAYKAARLYPDPVGDLVRGEMLAFEQFGYRFAGGRGIARLVEFLEKKWDEEIENVTEAG